MQETGNSLEQKVIPLAGGLDLKSPRMLVEPGRLVDCVNYECTDIDGYKRIDGFERYDGGPSPSTTRYWSALTTSVFDPTRDGFRPGEFGWLVGTHDGNTYETRIVFGLASIAGEAYAITFIPDVDISTWEVSFGFESSDNFFFYNLDRSDSEVIDSNAGFWSLSNDLATSIVTADSYRSLVDSLPDNAFPYGVQLYRDRAFVLANCRSILIAFDTDSTPTVGESLFYIGNYIRVGSDPADFTGVILDYKFLRGDFGTLGTNAATRAWARLLVYPTVNGPLVTDTTAYVDLAGTAFGLPTDVWKYYSAIDVNGPADTEIWGGVLYKSLEEGTARTSSNDWTQIDMGYEVEFYDGDSDIVPRELTLSTTEAQLNNEPESVTGSPDPAVLDAEYSGAVVGYSAYGLPPTDTALSGVDLSAVDGQGAYMICTSTGGWPLSSGRMRFSALGLNVPSDVIITGLKLEATCRYNSSAAPVTPLYFSSIRFVKDVSATNTGLSTNRGGPSGPTIPLNVGSDTTITIGGEADKWGYTNLTPEDVTNEAFGIEMTPFNPSTNVTYLHWDSIKVTVYFYRPVGKLFFHDGSSEIEAKLVRIHTSKGSWDGTTKAEGVAHIYGPLSNGTRNYIKPGENIRLVSNTTPGVTTIAKVRSIRGSFLPSHADVVASDRRIQMIRANYSLNRDWETIYGVTGLGRAFSYDNTYFRKIYSDYDSTLDKPTHICSYRNYLVLGYPSGNILLSAISGSLGPLPEQFSAVQGAREFSFVDDVHGLAEAADTSLIVFCRSSINRLELNKGATSLDNLFSQSSISSTSGCIEYTVASFGSNILYCDQHAIRSIKQTDVYGDLVAKPISSAVSPWLRQRLSAKKYWTGTREANRVLFAHTVKAKNQYRVWFNDGCVLSMNWNSENEAPQFMKSKYGFNFGGAFVPLTPIAYCNDTDNQITERIFVCHWNRDAGTAAEQNSATYFKYLFELEKGWSFDGQDFPAKLTFNFAALASPFGYENVRKVDTHAMDYGATTLFAAFGTSYSEEKSYTGMSFSSTYVPFGTNPTSANVTEDFTPFSKMTQVAARGRPLFLKTKNTTTATGTDATCAIEPPHVLQVLIVHYTPLRLEV